MDYNILPDSPIYQLQFLYKGWDGYWANPLSESTLIAANKLWREIEQLGDYPLPQVIAGANGTVIFNWYYKNPGILLKELDIWVYGMDEGYAEWLLIIGDRTEEEGISQSESEAIGVIKRYHSVRE